MCPITNPYEWGPSQYLSWKELACKDGTEYPAKWRGSRAIILANLFEDIRSIYNKPIRILSAYRSPSHNRAIGGARFSQHVEGRAMDLQPPSGVSIDKFYSDIKSKVEEFGITGIGRYKTFVHVDFRPSGKLVSWSGTGVKDSGV